MKTIFFWGWIIFGMIACTPAKQQGNVSVIPLVENLEMKDISQLPFQLEQVQTICLALNDTALLESDYILHVDDHVVVMCDISGVYFFSAVDGHFLSCIKRRGAGPEEYNFIYDALYNPLDKTVSVLDIDLHKIKQYTPTGKFLNEFDSHGITAFGGLRNGNIVSIDGQMDSDVRGFTLWDSHFEAKDSISFNVRKKSVAHGSLLLYDFISSGDELYLYKKDTLFRMEGVAAEPVLVVGKGRLSMPDEVLLDMRRSDESESYIYNDMGLLSGNYFFYRYFYQRRAYSDIWDVKNQRLIFRQTDDGKWRGIPVIVNGVSVDVWPRYASADALYCVLAEEEMDALGIDAEAYNFVLLKIKIG